MHIRRLMQTNFYRSIVSIKMEIVPTVFGENLLFGISMESMKEYRGYGGSACVVYFKMGQYDISFSV